jgi:hypothetical protein
MTDFQAARLWAAAGLQSCESVLTERSRRTPKNKIVPLDPSDRPYADLMGHKKGTGAC